MKTSDFNSGNLLGDMHNVRSEPTAPTVGISTEVVAPEEAKADLETKGGETLLSIDAGALGTAMDITELAIVQGCSCSFCQGLSNGGGKGTNGENPNGANPDNQFLGELLTMGTNPDGSRFF